jgi:hypothetical protein
MPFALYSGKKSGGVAMKRLITLLMIVLLFPVTAYAQEFKVPVEVQHTGDDSVGLRVAYTLKENIRKSQGMVLVTDTQARMKVVLVSLNIPLLTDDRTNYSAISVAIVFDSLDVPAGGVFLTSMVYDVGRDRVVLVAEMMLAALDREIDRLRRLWPSLYSQMQYRERVL